jgi:hypothetical protein
VPFALYLLANEARTKQGDRRALVVKRHMSDPKHRLRPLPAAPLVVRRRYLLEAPSPLLAAPLVVRRTMIWPSRRCALRVFSRCAHADARPAVRSRVDNRARVTHAAATPAARKVAPAPWDNS